MLNDDLKDNIERLLRMALIIACLNLALVVTPVSASLSCSPSNINMNANLSSSVNPTSVNCYNPADSPTTCWFNFNTFTTNPSSLTFQNLSNLTFQVNYNTQLIGSFNDYLFCPDSTVPLNVHLEVSQVQPPQSGTCNLGASLSSLTQAVEQNTEYTLPKITFEPINCNQGTLILDSSHIRIVGGVVLQGVNKPVSISSIVSDGVNLAISTKGLNIQPYVSNLEINAFGKTFQIPITIVVTSGASDTTTFDCSQIPTCTITNSIMSINNSNSLICSQIPSGLKIIPQVDSNYIIGTNVQQTSTQYIWYFKGLRNGVSKVKAGFTYLDAPVCNSFSQDVSIQSSGVITGTNSLKLVFTPDLSLVKPNQDVIINIAETGSNSLIPNAQLFIDAVSVNPSNDTFTFHSSFISNKNYSLRAMATGYADLVQTVNLNVNPISINITPTKGDSETQFSISTSPDNSSLFLDGNKVSNPYMSTIQPGLHEIRAIREGYLDGVMNITVDSAVFVTPSGEFKKGTLQVFTLNKNATCQVNYRKNVNSGNEILLPPQIAVNKIQFTPSQTGIYEISCNGIVKYTSELKGVNWNAKWWFMPWYLWIGIPLILFFVVRIYNKNKSPGSLSTVVS